MRWNLVLLGLLLSALHAFPQGTATLAWNPSRDATVTGYRLYMGGVSCVYTQSWDAGAQTVWTVGGLAREATFYFAVTAYDGTGLESSYSAQVVYRVPAAGAPLPPDPPAVQPGNALVRAGVDFWWSTNLTDWQSMGSGIAWLEFPATNAVGFVRARMQPLTIELR